MKKKKKEREGRLEKTRVEQKDRGIVARQEHNYIRIEHMIY